MTALSWIASRPMRAPKAEVAWAPHRCRNPRCRQRLLTSRPRLGLRAQDVAVIGVPLGALIDEDEPPVTFPGSQLLLSVELAAASFGVSTLHPSD